MKKTIDSHSQVEKQIEDDDIAMDMDGDSIVMDEDTVENFTLRDELGTLRSQTVQEQVLSEKPEGSLGNIELGSQYAGSKYEISQKLEGSQMLDGAEVEWIQVRHIPPSLLGWDLEDNLQGSEVFGDPLIQDGAWAIAFLEMEFNQIKVESYDKEYVKQYTRDDIIGNIQVDELLKDKQKIE